MPSGSATTRSASAPEVPRLFEHDLFGKPLHAFPDHALRGQLHNTLNGKPRAAQAVAQGFPADWYANRVDLQQPARDHFVGRCRSSDPERTYAVDEALRFLARQLVLSEVIKRGRV